MADLLMQGYGMVSPDSPKPRSESELGIQKIGTRKIYPPERRADALGTLARAGYSC